MAHYLSRKFVCERLKLGLSQSFRLLPSCYGALISSEDVLDLLNNSRRMIAEPFLDIPTDIVTADELAAAPEFAQSGITAHNIIVWTQRRTKKIPPHIRVNKHTVRFPKKQFLDWLDAVASRRRRVA